MCFTCSAKVRTPLNSPFVGANEYFSSGIASAADMTCCSTRPYWMLRTEARVGGCCWPAVEPPWACAAGAGVATRRTKNMARFFIRLSIFCEEALKSYALGGRETIRDFRERIHSRG